jgi:CubicO group peptidase (beta-lactamase class C family)
MHKRTNWKIRLGWASLSLIVTIGILLLWVYQKPGQFAGMLLDPSPTAAELNLYIGPDKQDGNAVTWANWMQAPFNRLAFRRISDFLNTVPISRVSDKAASLETAPLNQTALLNDLDLPNDLSLDVILKGTDTDAFIALKDGKVLVEHYFNGQRPESKHIMMSVTKSFTGIIAEMMILEGLLDENELIGNIVPELENTAFADATLRNVLDMEVSMVFDETYADPSSDISQFIYASGLLPWPDDQAEFDSLYGFLSSLKKKDAHGREFQYTTATTEVLGWVITKRGGRPFQQQFEERIYGRIGAEYDAYFAADTQNVAVAGGGLSVTLRDMARLVLLVANDGFWNGQQIVPQAIIQKIKQGGDPSHFPDFLGESASYKSQWYVDAAQGTLRALGIHGQEIFIDSVSGIVIVQQSSHPDAVGMYSFLSWALQDAFAKTYSKTPLNE